MDARIRPADLIGVTHDLGATRSMPGANASLNRTCVTGRSSATPGHRNTTTRCSSRLIATEKASGSKPRPENPTAFAIDAPVHQPLAYRDGACFRLRSLSGRLSPCAFHREPVIGPLHSSSSAPPVWY